MSHKNSGCYRGLGEEDELMGASEGAIGCGVGHGSRDNGDVVWVGVAGWNVE